MTEVFHFRIRGGHIRSRRLQTLMVERKVVRILLHFTPVVLGVEGSARPLHGGRAHAVLLCRLLQGLFLLGTHVVIGAALLLTPVDPRFGAGAKKLRRTHRNTGTGGGHVRLGLILCPAHGLRHVVNRRGHLTV